MPADSVQMYLSITFTANTVAEGEAIINAIPFPEGAQVNVSATQHLSTGVVEGGEVVGPATFMPEPLEAVTHDDAPVPEV